MSNHNDPQNRKAAVTRMQVLACIVFVIACQVSQAFELQGHRGARGLWPENTLAGFENALAIGVDVLELDVGLTSDNVVVVSHNPRMSPSISRDANGEWLTEPGLILRHSTLAQVQTFDVGRINPHSRYAQRFPDQTAVDGQFPPTLANLFARVRELGADQVRFNIELKLSPTPSDWFAAPETFARAVVDTIEKAGLMSRVSIQSFDWRALAAVRKIAPKLPLVALTAQQRWLDNIQAGQPGVSPWTAGFDIDHYDGSIVSLIQAVGAGTWSPYWREVTPELVAAAHKNSLQIIVWTVNKERDILKMLDLGVDGIISDYPDRARNVMRSRGMRLPVPVPGR